MSKTSKMVFVAFMQHYIQSTVTHFVTHVEGVKDVKYYVLYSAVVDPGFPQGWGANSPGGTNIRFCQIFPKTA